MHDDYREKLKEQAAAIAQFQNLTDDERRWLRPLLSRGLINTLELLDLIIDKPRTFEELAADLGCSVTSVTQKLNALAEGGYPIDLTGTTAIAITGRPRKLARRQP